MEFLPIIKQSIQLGVIWYKRTPFVSLNQTAVRFNPMDFTSSLMMNFYDNNRFSPAQLGSLSLLTMSGQVVHSRWLEDIRTTYYLGSQTSLCYLASGMGSGFEAILYLKSLSNRTSIQPMIGLILALELYPEHALNADSSLWIYIKSLFKKTSKMSIVRESTFLRQIEYLALNESIKRHQVDSFAVEMINRYIDRQINIDEDEAKVLPLYSLDAKKEFSSSKVRRVRHNIEMLSHATPLLDSYGLTTLLNMVYPTSGANLLALTTNNPSVSVVLESMYHIGYNENQSASVTVHLLSHILKDCNLLWSDMAFVKILSLSSAHMLLIKSHFEKTGNAKNLDKVEWNVSHLLSGMPTSLMASDLIADASSHLAKSKEKYALVIGEADNYRCYGILLEKVRNV